MKCCLKVIGWAWLFSQFVAGGAIAGGVDLSPRFEFGGTAYYISHGIIEHEIRIPGTTAPEKITVKTESGMVFEVTAVEPDGTATLTWTLRYMVISASGLIPGLDGALDYDSRAAQASTSPLAPLFAGFVNRPVTVRAGASGNVLDYRGPDASTSGGAAGGILGGFLSKAAFEQLPMFVTGGAPKSVGEGATWSRTMNVTLPLVGDPLVIDQKFNVTRVDSSAGTVAFNMDGKLSSASGRAPSTSGGGSPGASSILKVDNGAVGGRFVWDYRTGNLISAETELRVTTELDSVLGRMHLQQTMSSAVNRVTQKQLEQK